MALKTLAHPHNPCLYQLKPTYTLCPRGMGPKTKTRIDPKAQANPV